ncbi:RNA polymerase II-associated protein [Fistulina hepatica ATCC 64428]|uniref:RNA polymerase II-associated protein n=1 Tax=Fistulina hepatica ATCC 64428 TaxID=1128425 RepID=A0A0D7ALK6_9AGAR|nr:RNA polymerase II-associated protein [Fistulina hepatica ATCC 64428]
MDDGQAGKCFEIGLVGGQILSIDPEHLDPEPSAYIDVLREGRAKVSAWTELAGAYWRHGQLDDAQKIAETAVEEFDQMSQHDALGPVFNLLANLELAHARNAPKIVLADARQDVLTNSKKKEDHYHHATQYLNMSDAISAGDSQTDNMLTRAILQLSSRAMEDAFKTFDFVLSENPTNCVAQLGKARILYAQRKHGAALKIFQDVLRLNPHCMPDPRIGIGLCLASMGHHQRAKAAWQRSLDVNPGLWPAQLLLGIQFVNEAIEVSLSDNERKRLFVSGTNLIQAAFKTNQRNAAAANAMCELFLRKGISKSDSAKVRRVVVLRTLLTFSQALKLAERTVQYADTLTVFTEGHIRSGRVLHVDNAIPEATRHFASAAEGQPKNAIAAIGLAQMQLLNDETAAAIHTLDRLSAPAPTATRTATGPPSIPATVMLASLRAAPRPGLSSSDAAKERERARELYKGVLKDLQWHRHLAQDADMYTEIAQLCLGGDDAAIAEEMLDKVVRAAGQDARPDPRTVNNVAVISHIRHSRFQDARQLYEQALTDTASLTGDAQEATATTVLYNLGRVYEELGEHDKAREAYNKLLSRHPEYTDAKVRLAAMLTSVNNNNEAHELLKQALAAHPRDLNLRAVYTHFLIQTGLPKIAKEFVFSTLKDMAKHDIYALCAAGLVLYSQARESRDATPKGVEERRKQFVRAAEFYQKALQIDPACAMAAQGLAIAIAEDALGTLGGGGDAIKHLRDTNEALDVFGKVRESIDDGSVYLNMGHCHYSRDEFDRAIESYETASERFYGGRNISALLCLCRSWYAKATKSQSYAAMNTCLSYAQRAFHICPQDKAILYNIAMIQQKSAEMMFTLPPEKRTLVDLQRAIHQATHAQELFASLASDRATMVPYSRDIADQRRKYGENMLRKSEDHLSRQREYEDQVHARQANARQRRMEDKARQQEIERRKAEESRIAAQQLAEERRKAREQAQEWSREAGLNESDDEQERTRKPKKRKQKAVETNSSDDETPMSKRRRSDKKESEETSVDEEAIFSETEEGAEKSRKASIMSPRNVMAVLLISYVQRSKKRAVRDDDDEETVAPSRKSQKQYKEILSDTDEENI